MTVCCLAPVLKPPLFTHLYPIPITTQAVGETEMLLKFLDGERLYFLSMTPVSCRSCFSTHRHAGWKDNRSRTKKLQRHIDALSFKRNLLVPLYRLPPELRLEIFSSMSP
jgi:hypothetical protein